MAGFEILHGIFEPLVVWVEDRFGTVAAWIVSVLLVLSPFAAAAGLAWLAMH